MLPKEHRLKKSSEFKTVYNLKKSVANSLLILYVGKLKENNSIPTKAGFIVSKKISKRAVKRNKIKRQLRESFKKYLSQNNVAYESIVLIARDSCLASSFEQIDSAVEHILKLSCKKFIN